MTVKNIGDEARTFTNGNQTLIDTKGREFDADPEASLWTDKESKSFLQQINPGNSVKGYHLRRPARHEAQGHRIARLDVVGRRHRPLGNR